MRAFLSVLCLALLTVGCASMSSGVANADLYGTFGASFDFHASARIRLKSDHTFEMYTASFSYPPTTPPSAVAESSGHENGRWTLNGKSVVLTSKTGTSQSLEVRFDQGVLFLVRGKLRYRMLYPEEPSFRFEVRE